MVHYHFGYVQIHKKGYWDDKTIDNVFDPSSLVSNPIEGVAQMVPRIESFALASFGKSTKGALVMGIDPAREAKLTSPDSRIESGKYLKDDDDGALVAEGLAEYLDLKVGDTLVLISQGYHGINAAGKFPVRGLVHFGSPDLNKQLLYIGIEQAKWFYGTEGQVTTLVADLSSRDDIPQVVSSLRSSLDTASYEIMDYKEMMPDLIKAREVDTASSQIILLILYFIIGFGIFGTILMMLKEREYEFGILKAIGMRTGNLSLMLWLEIIFLGLIGCLAGILVSLPLVYYYNRNPIELSGQMAEAYERFGVQALLPASTDISIFLTQAVVIFLMITVLSIYPMFKLASLKPVEAMRA